MQKICEKAALKDILDCFLIVKNPHCRIKKTSKMRKRSYDIRVKSYYKLVMVLLFVNLINNCCLFGLQRKALLLLGISYCLHIFNHSSWGLLRQTVLQEIAIMVETWETFQTTSTISCRKYEL